MPDVRYVCLSDLHFGAKCGVLTPLDDDDGGGGIGLTSPNPVLADLLAALGTLVADNESGEPPTLILLGDVLDLALSGQHRSAVVFEQFVAAALARDTRLFADTIYYVPGNHDHHLWELVRDQQLHRSLRTSSPGDVLETVPHASPLGGLRDGDDPAEVQLLTLLIRRTPGCEDVNVVIGYPNLGLHDAAGSRVAVFHHGHFVEPVYRLVSNLKYAVFPDQGQPIDVHELEAENHAWIDFVWGTLGQSGRAGQDMTTVYEMFGSEHGMKWSVDRAVQLVAPDDDHASLLRRLAGHAAGEIAGAIGFLRERHHHAESLSEQAQRSLRDYLAGPIRRQLDDEKERAAGFDPARELVFVFGHTHKPFAELDLAVDGYDAVDVINTGGWVIDSVKDDSRQGAAVVVLDETLHPVSIRCYHEGSRTGGVELDGRDGPFLDHVRSSVRTHWSRWDDLAGTAALAVDERQEDLSERDAATLAGREG